MSMIRRRLSALFASPATSFAAPSPAPPPAAASADVAALHGTIDQLTRAVDRLAAGQKQDRKWRMIFRKQLAALVRAQYVKGGLAGRRALEARRFRLRSQNEEDGITLALFEAVGTTDCRFVEIGCGGTGGNSAVLAYELGWSGLMVDASGSAVRVARHLFRANPDVVVHRAIVSPESINRLFKRHALTGEIDFLSIDVDSVDYWLLDALAVTTARVLVMEYNALFGPDRAVTVPNAPLPDGAPKGYAGASLAAIDKAATRKGYRLVLCEDAGVNAFFVRADLAPDIPTLTPAQAWRPIENKFDPTGESVRGLDLFALVEARGLPLVEV